MSTEPRELFPVTFMGPKNNLATVGGSRNPDGTPAGLAHLADVPEPTAEDIAALEAGDVPAALVLDPPVDPEPAMANPVGKGKGAAAKD